MSQRTWSWVTLLAANGLGLGAFALIFTGHQAEGLVCALVAFVIGGLGRGRFDNRA